LEEQARVDYLFNACSTIDCLFFAAYGLASGLAPTTFPTDIETHLRFDRSIALAGFVQTWPTHALTVSLQAIADSEDVRQVITMRDVSTHRGSPPRSFYLGGPMHRRVTTPSNPKAFPDLWVSDLDFGPSTFASWQTQVSALVGSAVEAVAGFEPLTQ
jgi:hypothetical protein